MQFFKSMSAAARALLIVCTLLVLIVVFWAGTAVGYRQAEFAYRWDGHFAEVFGGPGSPFAGRSPKNEGFQANGTSGRIIAVNLPYVAVQNPNQTEKVVVIGSSTMIRFEHELGSTTSMRPGDVFIAVGSPDIQGRIVASFIRVMPSPATSTVQHR